MNNQLESYTLVQSYSYERLDVFFTKSCRLKTASYAQERLRKEGWSVTFLLESYRLVAIRKVRGIKYIPDFHISFDLLTWVYFDDSSGEWVTLIHDLYDPVVLELYRGKSENAAVDSAKESLPE